MSSRGVNRQTPTVRQKRCINCSFLIPRNLRTHSLEQASTPMINLLQSWITPTELTLECVLCTECLTLLQNQANTISDLSQSLPAFGHRRVCFSCGNSILRATRTYPVRQDRQERNILIRHVPLHLISRLERVCAACWRSATREIQRLAQHNSNQPGLSEATLPDAGSNAQHNLDKNTPREPSITVKRPIPENTATKSIRRNEQKGTVAQQRSDVQEPTSTNESQASEPSSKNIRTVRVYKRGLTKQTDEPTSLKQSENDHELLQISDTNLSQTAEDNNTSSCTKVTRTHKRRRIQTADVKLPEAEELIANVFKFLEAEYEFLKYHIGDICDLSPLTNVLKRTADACGVDKCTVRHILNIKQSSVAEEDSSCDDSEVEEQDEKLIDDGNMVMASCSIKDEESSTTDSVDEPDDNIVQADNVSEERDECEVEAPNMDIDYHEVRIFDPLNTEPVEIKKETTDLDPESVTRQESRCDILDIKPDNIELSEAVSEEVIQCEEPVQVKIESLDALYSDNIACTSDIVCETSCDVKREPPEP